MSPEELEARREITRAFMETIPFNRALGIELAELGAGTATMNLPWSARLTGDPETGVLHGGVVTTFLDACCGTAVFMGLAAPQPIATLDLRIDYLKPAAVGRDLVAEAHCYKFTRHVAFCRATAFQGPDRDPVATAAGTFMVGTKGKRS